MTAPDDTSPAEGAPITTGSGVERSMACLASNVLERAWVADTEHSARGVAVHAYLERISNGMTAEESLALVDEEYREVCEGLDLSGLALDQLSAEVTFVINLVTGEARVLGQGLERDYSGVGADELPLTIDLAGVDPVAHRGSVADHKYGYSRRTRCADNWQPRSAAYAIAKTFDLDEVDGALIRHRQGGPPYIDRAVFTAADFAVMRAEFREHHQRVLAARAAYARGEHVEPTEGPHCRYCPCAWSCPAKIGTLRAALAADDKMPITVADAGKTLEMIKAGKRALAALEERIYAMAAEQPLLLRVEEDGTEVWLGNHPREGNEVIDGVIAIDVAAEELKVPAAELAAFQREVAPPDTVTKKALHAAIMRRAAPRTGSAKEREILQAIRDRGGAKKPIKNSIGIYTRSKTEAA